MIRYNYVWISLFNVYVLASFAIANCRRWYWINLLCRSVNSGFVVEYVFCLHENNKTFNFYKLKVGEGVQGRHRQAMGIIFIFDWFIPIDFDGFHLWLLRAPLYNIADTFFFLCICKYSLNQTTCFELFCIHCFLLLLFNGGFWNTN